MKPIHALFTLVVTSAHAEIDRSGNVMGSDGGGPLTLSSVAMMILYFGGIFCALYFLTAKFGEHAGAIYFFGGIFVLLVIGQFF